VDYQTHQLKTTLPGLPEYCPGFEKWWKTQERKYAAMPGALQAAFKEVAWTGYNAAATMADDVLTTDEQRFGPKAHDVRSC
jgi:hypothetical protein